MTDDNVVVIRPGVNEAELPADGTPVVFRSRLLPGLFAAGCVLLALTAFGALVWWGVSWLDHATDPVGPSTSVECVSC